MSNALWNFSQTWNAGLEEKEERPPEKRDRLWASELTKGEVDTWLKLRGEPYTNPPNARSKRKFEAGNVFEWIMGIILKRAGLLVQEQKYCVWQYPGLLKVSGKIDFIAGGDIDYDGARKFADEVELPEVFKRCTEKVLAHFKEKYPKGLGVKPIEIKSCSSFVMETVLAKEKPLKSHKIQLYHYLQSDNHELGDIIYICRDDLRIAQFTIWRNEENEKEYKECIERHSKNHASDAMPEIEPLLIFSEDTCKFSKNYNIEYSCYLTKLYGFKEPQEYSDLITPKVARWNRVMKRIKDGANITKKNEEVIEEMKLEGFSPDKYMAQFNGIIEETEEL